VPAEINVGDEHLFRVEASAPIRTVKWFKNGQEIEAPPGARLKLKDVSPKKYELEIMDAVLEDGATYRVSRKRTRYSQMHKMAFGQKFNIFCRSFWPTRRANVNPKRNLKF
jgi:hypothetical protein